MPTLISIRLIQLKRELNEAGIGVLIVFGIFLISIYYAYLTFQKTPDSYYLTAILFSICTMLHTWRKDKLFVFVHVRNPHLEIYLEYLFLTFPLAITSLFTSNWICFPLLIIALWFIPYLRYSIKQTTYFKHISRLIHPSNFELISGFRKSFFFLIPIYTLALGFSWFRILPLFLLWFITVTIASFYTECEPLHILKEGNPLSKSFLKRKLMHHTKILLLLYLPILGINTVFNPEYWILNILFALIQVSLLCFAICLKYATYEPNKDQISSNIIISLVSLGSIIPYLLPIPVVMTLVYYRKALNNLSEYLND